MGSGDLMFDDLRIFSKGNIVSEKDLNAIMKSLMGLDSSDFGIVGNNFTFGTSGSGVFTFDANGNIQTITIEKKETTNNIRFTSNDFQNFTNPNVLHIDTLAGKPIVKIDGNQVPFDIYTETETAIIFNNPQTDVTEIVVDDLHIIHKISFTVTRDVDGCLSSFDASII